MPNEIKCDCGCTNGNIWDEKRGKYVCGTCLLNTIEHLLTAISHAEAHLAAYAPDNAIAKYASAILTNALINHKT